MKPLFLAVALAFAAPMAGAASLSPLDDSFVRGGSNSNNNYGSSSNLSIKSQGSPRFQRRGLLKFDVSGLAGPLESATLSLSLGATSGLTTNLRIYGLTDGAGVGDAWSESTVTWNNAPPAFGESLPTDSTFLGQMAINDGDAAGTTFTLSGAALVNFLQMPGPDGLVTFGLRSTSTSDASVLQIASKENATIDNRPVLTVELTPVPLPAGGWLLMAGIGAFAAFRSRERRSAGTV